MNRLIKYSIPIKKKAAMFDCISIKKKAAMLDWLFGHKKIIVIVDSSDYTMMLFCHGQYVWNGQGEPIKLPNAVSQLECCFRRDGPIKYYYVDCIDNAVEYKAKWLDALLELSLNGYRVMYGYEVLLPANVQMEKLLISFDLACQDHILSGCDLSKQE